MISLHLNQQKQILMKHSIIIILTALTVFTSCKKDEETIINNTPGVANINFDAVVGSADFALDKDFVIEGKTYKFNKLRYWVSNISLIKSDDSEFQVEDSYFLIEETSTIDVQDGLYTYPAKKKRKYCIT